MFTGIVEALGRIKNKVRSGTNINFLIESPFTHELKVDQSMSHNGVCLTVTEVFESDYQVTVIQETLKKTNFSELKIGDFVNLERSMPATGRFDGHIVQGHVDQIGICETIKDQSGSWLFTITFEDLGNITVEKGSICVNGVSLTVVNSMPDRFTVAIIPYTFEHTSFKMLKEGNKVNLEFDIVGKYLQKLSERNIDRKNIN
jgi:riboflavin synthase